MARDPGAKEIHREAEAHIELGMLLRKHRSEENKKAVEKLLRSNLQLGDIIREIKKIDCQKDEEKNKEIPQEKPPGREIRTEQPLRHSMSVVHTVIKMPYQPMPYLVFLFGELKKIRRFGKQTNVFNSVFFPPNVRLNESIKKTFTKDLVRYAAELHKTVILALEQGWYYLEKMDYNLLVILRRLCSRIMSLQFNSLDFKDRYLIDKLLHIETLFLILNYRSNYSDLLIYSLHRVLDNDPRYKGEKDDIANLIQRILYPDVMLPSLCNFLVGLNMLKYRRHFSPEALICRDPGEILNTRDFACEPGIWQRIENFVQQSREKLVQLIEQRTETEHLILYLPVKKSGEMDYGLLRKFYEGSGAANPKYGFREDKENLMAFAPRFYRAFDSILFPLLCGRITLQDIGKTYLFTKNFFPIEFPKLRQIVTKLEKMTFSYRHFPFKRYFQIKEKSTGGIPVELEIINLVGEGVDLIIQIGRKLEKVLASHHQREDKDEETIPLDAVHLRGKTFSVPYENRKIRFGTILNNRGVLDALSFAVSICFMASAFFQNLEKLDVTRNIKQIDLKINSQLDAVERIADAETFQELKSLFARNIVQG
jgi:hypothetical protein